MTYMLLVSLDSTESISILIPGCILQVTAGHLNTHTTLGALLETELFPW